jgi:predicted aminopeptidase
MAGQPLGISGCTVVTFTGVVVSGTKAIFSYPCSPSSLIRNPNKSEKLQVLGLPS